MCVRGRTDDTKIYTTAATPQPNGIIVAKIPYGGVRQKIPYGGYGKKYRTAGCGKNYRTAGYGKKYRTARCGKKIPYGEVRQNYRTAGYGKKYRTAEGREKHRDARRNCRAGAPERANHAPPSPLSSLISTCPIRGSIIPPFVYFVYFVVHPLLNVRTAELPCGRARARQPRTAFSLLLPILYSHYVIQSALTATY